MRKALILVILVTSIGAAHAQPGLWSVTYTPSFIYTNNIRYGLQLGAERKLSPRFSVLTELTVIPGGDKDSSALNTKYFRIKPELRFLLSKNESMVRLYGGLQFSYVFRQWDNIIGGSYFQRALNEDTTIRFDQARITSPVFTSSLQLGTIVNLGPHFAIDLFTGMGIRFIDTKYTNVQNGVKNVYFRPICTIMFSPSQAWWVDGKMNRFHLNSGMRVIYRF
jgi:hypothetical protein